MREQSHKDEMSALLRADFERLRGRGVAVALAPADSGPEAGESAEAPPDRTAVAASAGRRRWLGRLLDR